MTNIDFVETYHEIYFHKYFPDVHCFKSLLIFTANMDPTLIQSRHSVLTYKKGFKVKTFFVLIIE